MTIQWPSKATLFLLAVVIVLCWMLFRGCGKAAPDNAAQLAIVTHKSDSIAHVAKLRADSIKQLKAKDEYSNEVIEEVGVLFQQADSTVQSQKEQFNALQHRYLLAQTSHDTAAELKDCDTLNKKYTALQKSYDEADNQCTDYVFKSSRELYHKDSIIGEQSRQIGSLQSLVDLADTVYRLNKLSGKLPLLRGYIGPTLGVGAWNNFGLDLHLLNRKDLMYTGSIKLGPGGFMYGVGVSKLITFKKH